VNKFLVSLRRRTESPVAGSAGRRSVEHVGGQSKVWRGWPPAVSKFRVAPSPSNDEALLEDRKDRRVVFHQGVSVRVCQEACF